MAQTTIGGSRAHVNRGGRVQATRFRLRVAPRPAAAGERRVPQRVKKFLMAYDVHNIARLLVLWRKSKPEETLDAIIMFILESR